MSKISGLLGGIRVGDSSPVRIMGVINLTKNSFYQGSVKVGPADVISLALKMREEGSDFIDVGARSTAPYRKYDVPTHTETKLLSEAVRAISNKVDVPISADTSRYEPAAAALKQGATILNDVHGLGQKDGSKIADLASSKNCSILLSAHESRIRKTADPITRITNCLNESIKFASARGVKDEQITIDPGIGFFKDATLSNVEWNCSVIARLRELRPFGLPICVAVSRKKFIGKLIGDKPAESRLSGSLSATAIAVYNGAHIIRTHDAAETVDAIRVARGVREKSLIPQLRSESKRAP